MNKRYFRKLTNKVSVILITIMCLIMMLIVAHWILVVVPVVKSGEQTKADLLAASYAQLIEQALEQGDDAEVGELLNRLMLLTSSEFNIPMVLKADVKLLDGKRFSKQQAQDDVAADHFIAQAPLFSPVSSDLIGELQLDFNAARYNRVVSDAQFRLGVMMLILVFMLLIVQRLLVRMLKPLKDLADFLQHVENAGVDHVPEPERNVAVEIRQVWFAVEQLFSRLSQRESDVRREHDAAQSALREKLEAESANKAKSQFLANMSHELRTPLNAIIGYSEMLREDAELKQELELVNDLGKIQLAGKNLLALINDVLDLSKIEAGKMQLYLEDVKVSALVDEIVNTVTPMVEKNHNRLSIHCPAGIGTIQADQAKLRQSLLNLMSNAAKFTRDGEIQLAISRSDDSDYPLMRFSVKDTGIGLSEAQCENLFTAFSQVDGSTTREYGGTGLGLAISRNFCRMMGGDILVQSELGKGSIFTIELPLAMSRYLEQQRAGNLPLQEQRQRSGRQGRRGLREKRKHQATVLVIDADEMACDIALRHLSKEHYRVVFEHNGAHAKARIGEWKPDVILLDAMTPGMSGWDLLDYIKSNREMLHIPVIMMTMVDERKTAYSLGAVDYLMKPVERDELVNAVNRSVRKHKNDSVLVMDDDADSRKLIRLILENEGLYVVEAENAKLGLIRLAEQPPALILMDLVMSGMSGMEFLDEIKLRFGDRHIPVLVLTGAVLGEAEMRRLMLRVDGVIQKGAYSIDRVLNEVRQVISAIRPLKE